MRPHIPDHWKPVVRAHILKTRGKDWEHLSAFDFNSSKSVRVEWLDGSFAVFRYAFFLRHPDTSEIAIFTEHCGYHFLPGQEDFVMVREEFDSA